MNCLRVVVVLVLASMVQHGFSDDAHLYPLYEATQRSPVDQLHSVVNIDFDMDGDVDLFGVNEDRTSILFYERVSQTEYMAGRLFDLPQMTIQSFGLADLDSDGLLDLVILTPFTDGDKVRLFKGEGAAAFSEIKIPPLHLHDFSSIYFSDFDSDGHMDIQLGTNLQRVYFLQNLGAMTFATRFKFTGVGAPIDGFVVDIDGDADGDLVVTHYRSPGRAFSVYRNNGAWDFTLVDTEGVSYYTNQFFVADLESDGDIDIMTDLAVFENNGNGQFLRSHVLPPSDIVLRVGDLNGDGTLDAITKLDELIRFHPLGEDGIYQEPINVWRAPHRLGNSTCVFVEPGVGEGIYNLGILVGAAKSEIITMRGLGADIDCDMNGVPDGLQIVQCFDDCNVNMIVDSCDIQEGTAPDEDADGRIDHCASSCELTLESFDEAFPCATLYDCNQNNLSDECELQGEITWSRWTPGASVYHWGFYGDQGVIWGVSFPAGDGMVIDEVSVAIGASEDNPEQMVGREITVQIWLDPDGDGLPNDALPIMEYNTLTGVVRPIVPIDQYARNVIPIPPTRVDGICFITFSMMASLDDDEYPVVTDLNMPYTANSGWYNIGSGIEAMQGASSSIQYNYAVWADTTDCNRNGTPDACDIESGLLPDLDEDGVPDSCPCASDIALDDGIIDAADLIELLYRWGPCQLGFACDADVVFDQHVNDADLIELLNQWGSCTD